MRTLEMKLDYSMVGRIQNFQAAHPQVMQKEAVYEEAGEGNKRGEVVF